MRIGDFRLTIARGRGRAAHFNGTESNPVIPKLIHQTAKSRDLPQDVKHLTLGYTLFDITERKPPVAQATLARATP